MSIRSVSVVGLGKLGACMAAAFAARGFDVVGADVRDDAVRAVNEGRAPVVEPGLVEMIAGNRSRLRATSSVGHAVRSTEATFIVVPTPSDPSGAFSLEYLLAAVRDVGIALRDGDRGHLVVITSTVLPGSTGGPVRETLETASGRTVGVDVGLAYNPEFIALGTVLRDFLNPDFVLIGCESERDEKELREIYGFVLEKEAPVASMNYVNAELTKLAVNTFVTTKIAFANMLASLCETLPAADVDDVTAALGLDGRIGPKYLKGGLGYGGPCFPRDNAALAALARSVGRSAPLAEATDAFNRAWAEALSERVRGTAADGARIAILGLAYKPRSNVVEESAGLILANRLVERGFDVVVHDPLALENARMILGEDVTYAPSAEAAVANADVIVVANPDEEYERLPEAVFQASATVVDCWRLLRDRLSERDDIRYIAVGLGPENP